MTFSPTLEAAVHGLNWATALACPRVVARLGGVPPKDIIGDLLDAFVQFSSGTLVIDAEGQQLALDPTGAFQRAHPHAVLLREHVTRWDATLPLPENLVAAARNMVEACGTHSVENWDEYEGPPDARDWLLWSRDPR